MLVNTNLFREAGLHWNKHKVYTFAPMDSLPYVEFWDEETRRCIEGYSVGGMKISGRHYFYLNYCPITRVPESVLRDKNKISATVDKITETPAFWEIDMAWWNAKEEAFNRPFGEGNHLVCLKTRGCGWSYKEAADGVYNYNFIPKSKSFYLASYEGYLIGDAIMDKVNDMLNHLNQYTDWYKNRQAKTSLMHKKASYYDENKDERGFLSEIIGQTVDKADKARGKRGKKISFEEAGSFPDLLSAWAIVRESVEQGGFLAGQLSAFGTGGEEGKHIDGIEELFSSPHGYNVLPFENHWFDGDGILDVTGGGLDVPYVPAKEEMNVFSTAVVKNDCGFFVPCYMANDKFYDPDGNMDLKASIDFEMGARKKLKENANDNRAVDKKTAERPFNGDEALKRMTFNPLPRYEAEEQLKRIRRTPGIMGMIKHGTLVSDPEEGVKFKLDPKARPILHYPHKNNEDLTGAVTLYEMPYKDKGVIPGNRSDLYYVVLDPYYKDDAEDRTSLAAAYVMKRANRITGTIGDTIVASYIARPNRLRTFYTNLLYLCDYYFATLQSEIAGGGKGVFDYFQEKNRLDVLELEIDNDQNKENQGTQRNRSYFMNMSTDRKKQGLAYFGDWLLEPRGINENGVEVLNIHKIFDEGLLVEIAKFVNDPKKNFDRVSSMTIAMFMRKVKTEVEINTIQENKSNFFNRQLFVDKPNNVKLDGDMIVF
jgi:hypothetical protein